MKYYQFPFSKVFFNLLSCVSVFECTIFLLDLSFSNCTYLPFLFYKHFCQMNIKKNIETRRIYISEFIFFSRDFKPEKSHMAMVSKNKKCREGPSSFGIREKSSAKSDHGLGSNFIGFLKFSQYNVYLLALNKLFANSLFRVPCQARAEGKKFSPTISSTSFSLNVSATPEFEVPYLVE